MVLIDCAQANSYNVNTKSEFESVQGKIEDAIRAATGGLVKVEAMREYVVSEVADAVNSRVEEIVGLNSLRKSPSNVKPDLDSTRIVRPLGITSRPLLTRTSQVKLEELDEAIATALKTSVPSHLRSRLEAVESLANQLEVLEAQTYGMDTNLDARIVGLAQKEIAKDLQHLVEDELSHALTPMRLANLVQTSFAGKRETGEKLNECERRFSDVERCVLVLHLNCRTAADHLLPSAVSSASTRGTRRSSPTARGRCCSSPRSRRVSGRFNLSSRRSSTAKTLPRPRAPTGQRPTPMPCDRSYPNRPSS